ncbi:hypothetical protein GCM10022255_013810 [Dactylosporangium darangshiense]|uniref:Uncharacterized protein n=1 Tax=Dactylosporangium darangshiense TaxID=579108 RepID=A0ABP8D186_9ACTN
MSTDPPDKPDRRVDCARFAGIDGDFSGELLMHRTAVQRILTVTFAPQRRLAVEVIGIALVVVVAFAVSSCKTSPIGTTAAALVTGPFSCIPGERDARPV